MENFLDRRILRTKRNLKMALLELLKEKTLNELSVTEVTKYAKCNRVTFYSHYKDLEDLLYQIFKEYLDELIQHLRKNYQALEIFKSDNLELITPIFEFVGHHQFVFTLMLTGEILPGSQNLFCEQLVEIFGSELSLKDNVKIDILAMNYYSTYATLGLFMYWIRNDCIESPESMAKKLAYLQSKIFNQAEVRKHENPKIEK